MPNWCPVTIYKHIKALDQKKNAVIVLVHDGMIMA
jgi:hypothetical protein